MKFMEATVPVMDLKDSLLLQNVLLNTLQKVKNGKVRLINADEELARIQKQQPNADWRIDDSPAMYCPDETDEDMSNPCYLSQGYVWITCSNLHKEM